MSFYVSGLVTYGNRCTSTSVFVGFQDQICSHIMSIFIYNYTYNIVKSICIDLSKIKVFVFIETVSLYRTKTS